MTFKTSCLIILAGTTRNREVRALVSATRWREGQLTKNTKTKVNWFLNTWGNLNIGESIDTLIEQHIRKFFTKKAWWQITSCFCIYVWKTTYQQQSSRGFDFNCMAEEKGGTRFLMFSPQMLVFPIFINWSNKRLLSYKSYIQGTNWLCVPKAIKSESIKSWYTGNKKKFVNVPRKKICAVVGHIFM